MSRKACDVPLREHRPRTAKEKASTEITKYFKPKRILQTIPENAEVKQLKKKEKDDNNNNDEPFYAQNINLQSKSVEKQSSAIAKSKNAINLLKLAQKQSAKEKGLREPISKDFIPSKIYTFVQSTPLNVDSLIKTRAPKSEYNFDALHTDDSTDYEDKRERTPYWSLYRNRLCIVIEQSIIKKKIIDTLFDSKPQTVQSNEIFKNTLPIVRRRSTAVWNTPPRYSMLPKY